MIVPGSANPLLLGDAGYNIQRSLRFRSSASAYLSRTPASAGNRKTWTWSGWVKRGSLTSNFVLFNQGGLSTNYTLARFDSSDRIDFQSYGSSSYNFQKVSTSVYRDPSAWYHFIFVLDATNTQARIYVNGSEVTYTTNTNPSNTDQPFNQAVLTSIGASTNPIQFFDGYLAEVNFIDGQALTPSSFGQTDPITGVWTPKKYAGTYGTNGFYLPFSDNTSATTLAYDKSGNGNNWTPNNISTTAGATYDSMTDVPTLTSATAANFCTLNPLDSYDYSGGAVGTYVTDANLKLAWTATAGQKRTFSTIAMPTSGKWYFEVQVLTTSANGNPIGISPITTNTNQNLAVGAATGELAFECADGNKVSAGTATSYGTAPSTNDVVMCAVDIDNAKIWWGKQGTWFASGDPAAGTNAAFTTLSQTVQYKIGGTVRGAVHAYNFGQRPFSYTPPTGFKALNTFNLPDPTIKKPNQYMDATTYTGNGTSRSITNAAGFQPDLVWIKDRTNAYSHRLFDSVRGVYQRLMSNTTDAEATQTDELTAFNPNGFSLNTSIGVNANADSYVAWCWKKGATPGFDIVTYTGTGSNTTVAHSLGVAPKMMIVKNRDVAGVSWAVYHETLGNTKAIYLNLTNAPDTNAGFWNNTSPTSSVFSVGTIGDTNQSTKNFVAYLFAEIAGFSKFGSYTGNGSNDGSFVYLGFRPKYLMVKCSSAATSWFVEDSSRDTYNEAYRELCPNVSNAEDTVDDIFFDFLSNGFKCRRSGGGLNGSGQTYIYAAFAETPFRFALAR